MSQRDKLGLALQTAHGTKKTTMDWFVPVTEAEFSPDRQTLEIDENIGSRVPLPEDLGSKIYKGSITGAVRPNSLPALMGAAFGSPTTSVLVAATAWSHTFDPVASGKAPRPMSVMTVLGDPTTDIVDLFYDAYINSLELSVATDDYMMFSADCVALHLDDTQSSPSSTHDGTSKFPFNKVGVQMAVNGGALADISCSNWRVRWNNNIEPDDVVLGDIESNGVTPGKVTIEGSFTVAGTDNVAAHYRRALLEDPDKVRLVLTATGANISGVHDYTVSVDVKRLRYTSAPVGIKGSDTLKGITIDFAAYLDETSGKAVEYIVKNSNAGSTY